MKGMNNYTGPVMDEDRYTFFLNTAKDFAIKMGFVNSAFECDDSFVEALFINPLGADEIWEEYCSSKISEDDVLNFFQITDDNNNFIKNSSLQHSFATYCFSRKGDLDICKVETLLMSLADYQSHSLSTFARIYACLYPNNPRSRCMSLSQYKKICKIAAL